MTDDQTPGATPEQDEGLTPGATPEQDEEPTPGPEPGPNREWRSAQHRVRNDLQTLMSLLRLSRRRVSDNTLPDEFACWLNGLAAVYDTVPLWDSGERLSIRSLVEAVMSRCDLDVRVTVQSANGVEAPTVSGLAMALAVSGLLTYSCRRATPGSTASVAIHQESDEVYIEVGYRPLNGDPDDWPPLSLSLAAEALNARYALAGDATDGVAVVVIPCR